MSTHPRINPFARRAAVTGLAIVGFITLVGAGMWLAIYSARYIPPAMSGLGAAAVYLGSLLTPDHAPTLSVIPSASTTIPFDNEISTAPAALSPNTSTTPIVPTPKAAPVTPGLATSNTYQMGGGTSSLIGLPDLIVSIDAVGYLATSSVESFVTATSVPSGIRPAVRFTVKNSGTNIAGAWRFSASIPTRTVYFYQSPPQQALNPGDHIEYTLGFDQANTGANQMVSVTANFDHAVVESNTNNNSASAQLTILGP